MTEERYNALMGDLELELTDDERREGWHWCWEFDGLLVGPGMGEQQFCGDFCKQQNPNYVPSVLF